MSFGGMPRKCYQFVEFLVLIEKMLPVRWVLGQNLPWVIDFGELFFLWVFTKVVKKPVLGVAFSLPKDCRYSGNKLKATEPRHCDATFCRELRSAIARFKCPIPRGDSSVAITWPRLTSGFFNLLGSVTITLNTDGKNRNSFAGKITIREDLFHIVVLTAAWGRGVSQNRPE